ncbi:MAG: hypothetical protein ABW184_12335 [Sphingobium sp.]
MRTSITLDDKIAETSRTSDRGYAAWKRTRIEKALAHSRDRDTMISSEKLLRDLSI